ncbi:MAG: DUF547 domain-containing protein [Bacteroidetes bacterium]|jgi:hypothetical protein|nr:DUF547 domain-containing protein [Bacteroidota bacterium]
MTPRRFRWSLALVLLLLVAPRTALTQDAAATSRAGDVLPADDYEALLTSVLEQVVTDDGFVRYDLLRGPLGADFRRVLKAIETFDASTLTTHDARLAFWINAYNVQMLQHIVETPSAQDIVEDGYAEAFFKTPVLTAQTPMTLDEIEHVILRGEAGRAVLDPFQLDTLDPRIHVGLNCAAISCPRLRQRAFTAANVDAELDAAMRDFTASPRHFRLDDGTYVVSSLLDWFAVDFDRPDRPAGDLLLRHMPTDRPDYDAWQALLAGRTAAALKARDDVRFAYDWTVNRASPAP